MPNHYHRLRIPALDSMRGLAAFAVVLCHIIAGLFYSRAFELSPLNMMIEGHESVIFFFVLSGFVLTYQYGSDPNYSYGRFLILRFMRLYIPYIFSILLCIILLSLCKPNTTSGLWITSFWKTPFNVQDILSHLLSVADFNTDKFNPIIWSLIHEMRIALLFPVILFIIRLNALKVLMLMLLVYLAAIVLNINGVNPSIGFCTSYLYTAIYLYTFVSGALIAKYQNGLVKLYNGFKTYQKWLFVIVALLIYNYAHLLPQVIKKFGLDPLYTAYTSDYVVEIFVTFAAVGFLIAAIANNGKQGVLTAKIPLFLGKISYSLYLVHAPVGAFIYYTLNNKFQLPVVGFLAVVVSVIVATGFNKFIEKPAMRIGKKLITYKIFAS